MIIIDKISPVAAKLLNAAENEMTLDFLAFHSVFEQNATARDKYDTLDAAARALCALGTANYSAVLAKKNDACPGSGFYEIYNNLRHQEFHDEVGHNSVHDLTTEEKQRLVCIERERVYQHAKEYFMNN